MPCVRKGCKGTHKFFKQAGTGCRLNKPIIFTEYEIQYLHHIHVLLHINYQIPPISLILLSITENYSHLHVPAEFQHVLEHLLCHS